jgi:long-chain acyl-CoA synthetase
MPIPQTLQAIIEELPAFGARRACGLRGDVGLRWWSYQRLYDGAYRAAAHLQEHGVAKGDHILIRGRNAPEWVAFFLGAMIRGAVVVPLDYDSPPELVARIASAVRPKLLIASGEIPEAIDSLPQLELREPDPSDSARAEVVAVVPSDPAVVFYTSGTTAAPRGVVLTHANIMAQILPFRRWRVPLRFATARMVVMAPFSHAQGFVLGIALPFSIGLSAIYTHQTHPDHLVRLLRDNRALLFSTVPRVLHMLALHFRSQPYRGKGPSTLDQKLRGARTWLAKRHYTFTHMRREVGYSFWMVLVGGAPLPQEDELFWRVSGCLLIQGYGLTETTAIVSMNVPLLGRFGSVGKPLGSQQIRLAGDGEILVRGPNVMPSYFGRADSADAFVDGYFRTGDIGRVDRQRLFLLGRKKEAIVTGEGFTIHPTDVEDVLRRMDGVEDAVVLGRDDGGHTRVHAVLLLRAGADAGAIVASANRGLLSQQRIQSWTVWPESDFPRTALLKPNRVLIAERVAQPPSTSAQASPDSIGDLLGIEDSRERIAAMARFIAGEKENGSEARLTDLGLSSLDTIELLAHLERQTGRNMDRLPVDELTTLSHLRKLTRGSVDHALSPLYRPDSPRWPQWPPVHLLRRLIDPPLLGALLRIRTRLTVRGLEHLQRLDPPLIFAGAGHQHGFDALLIYGALPSRLRKRLAVVTSRWVFTHYFEPDSDAKLSQRLLEGLGFHVLVPLFLPNVLSDPWIRSRESLMDACRLIDRGYSLVAFEGRGVGVVARQCGIPIVPVRLGTTSSTGFLPRPRRAPVSVTFESPLSPTMPEAELVAALDALFHRGP